MVRVRKIVAVATAALVSIGAVAGRADAADPVPPFIMPDASWLTAVNYYRAAFRNQRFMARYSEPRPIACPTMRS